MKTKIASAISAALLLGTSSHIVLAENTSLKQDTTKPISLVRQAPSYADINQQLESIAVNIAQRLNDVRFKQLIKSNVNLRLTGDNEVLLDHLMKQKIANGLSVRSLLTSNNHLSSTTENSISATELDSTLKQLNNIHIAIPHNQQWNPNQQTPLVAIAPEGIDEELVTQLKAFDSFGNVVWLDAQSEPTEPVMIVGLNERVDEKGHLKNFLPAELIQVQKNGQLDLVDCEEGGPAQAQPDNNRLNSHSKQTGGHTEAISDPCENQGGGGSGGGSPLPTSRLSGDQTIFSQILIRDDKEPWWKGSPEVYATWGFPGLSNRRFEMGSVDDEDKWYYLNSNILYWHQSYGEVIGMAIMEEDGGSYGTIKLSTEVLGINLNYSLAVEDLDDHLGSLFIHFQDPQNATTDTGNAIVKMQYKRP